MARRGRRGRKKHRNRRYVSVFPSAPSYNRFLQEIGLLLVLAGVAIFGGALADDITGRHGSMMWPLIVMIAILVTGGIFWTIWCSDNEAMHIVTSKSKAQMMAIKSRNAAAEAIDPSTVDATNITGTIWKEIEEFCRIVKDCDPDSSGHTEDQYVIASARFDNITGRLKGKIPPDGIGSQSFGLGYSYAQGQANAFGQSQWIQGNGLGNVFEGSDKGSLGGK